MSQEPLDDNNLNNVDLETQEESNLSFSNKSKIKFIMILILTPMLILSFYMIYLFIIKKFLLDERNFDFNFAKKLKINLTNEELNELTNKMSIVYDFISNPQNASPFFTPLFNIKSLNSEKSTTKLIPLNKISFMVSSSPSSAYLCKLYLDTWPTEYGSNIVKNTGIHPLITVYWRNSDVFPIDPTQQKFTNLEDYEKFTSYKINLINLTSYHRKWIFMISENIKTVPSDVEWFYMMDDDTLPFLDRVIPMLSNYEDPLNNLYLIHSPGERITTTHIGNGGAGFILSRKMVETILPNLTDCNNHLNRKHLNGDIRLDLCCRSLTNITPTFDY